MPKILKLAKSVCLKLVLIIANFVGYNTMLSFTITWNYLDRRKKRNFHGATFSPADIDTVGIIESVQKECFCSVAIPRMKRKFW